jgi:hypothetical protein
MMGELGWQGYNLALVPIPMLTKITFMTVPSVVTMFASMMYYSDFLRSQTLSFYSPLHIEEFDFIVGE